MTELVRTNGGETIHRAGCSYVTGPCTTAVPWVWAEGRSHAEIRGLAATMRYRRCQSCKPASGDGVIAPEYAAEFYRSSGHCRGCGQPGSYCQCTDARPCGCRDLHPMGSGLTADALDVFAADAPVDHPELFEETS